MFVISRQLAPIGADRSNDDGYVEKGVCDDDREDRAAKREGSAGEANTFTRREERSSDDHGRENERDRDERIYESAPAKGHVCQHSGKWRRDDEREQRRRQRLPQCEPGR